MVSYTFILPSVMVPVLSKQMTFTLARVSIQYNCWTRTLYLDSLITLTAITELVRRIRPSGIMPIKAATVAITESYTLPVIVIWFAKKRMPMGIIKIESIFNKRLNEPIIIELVFLLYLASLDILAM